MIDVSVQTIMIKLVIGCIIGGLIGYDREYKNRPAGIKTHILVCLGACILAMVQQEIMNQSLSIALHNSELANVIKIDQARLIAQIVSGIGFLGAGTIIVTKHKIMGLTTAASLWVTSGLGIAVGMGYYALSIISFTFVYIILTFLQKFVHINTIKKVEVKYLHREQTRNEINEYFKNNEIKIRDVTFKVEQKNDVSLYTSVYSVTANRNVNYVNIVDDMAAFKNVQQVRVISI